MGEISPKWPLITRVTPGSGTPFASCGRSILEPGSGNPEDEFRIHYILYNANVTALTLR